jgi:hypothetical protein
MSAHIDLLDDDGENRAVRSFLMQYSCDRAITVGAMRNHMDMSGWPLQFCPPFARTGREDAAHLTKAGAQVWIRHLFEMEAAQPTGQAATTASAQHELTVWYGPMPESNGKSNFTATLMRKGADFFDTDQYTFSRSEYPDRVRYEADFMRYLIGERTDRPEMWDKGYDFDKHSGYVTPDRAPAPSREADWQGGYKTGYETGLSDGRAEFTNPAATSPLERAAHAAHAGAEDDTARLDFMAQEECRIEVMAGPRYRLHWPDRGEWQREWHLSPRASIDVAKAAIATTGKGKP